MFYCLELGDTIRRNPSFSKCFDTDFDVVQYLNFIFYIVKLSWMGDFIDEIDPMYIYGEI